MKLNRLARRLLGSLRAGGLRKAVLIFVFFLALAQGVQAELVDRIVAVVNDDIILLSELETSLRALGATLDQQGYNQSRQSTILYEQRSAVLGRLIDDKLTDQQVVRHNIQVDAADEEATIQRILAVNRMSDDDLRRELELSGTTYEDYRRKVRKRILRSRLLSREVQSKIVITDSDIEEYYDAHQELYAGFAKYDLRHILMRVASFADQIEKMRVYHQIHDLHKRLQAGEAFDQLARLYSQADSASNGGHLGIYQAQALTDQVRTALKGLAEKEFSAVLQTEQGYQIFYIDKILVSGGKSLEEATPEIQEALHADMVDRKFQSWLQELRRQSHIHIKE